MKNAYILIQFLNLTQQLRKKMRIIKASVVSVSDNF